MLICCMKKFKNRTYIFIIFLSVFIGFLLVVIGMRFAKIEYPMFQTHDFHRGFALRPNASGWWVREGKAYVKINSQGLRDIEHKKSKKENTIRIAILGASFGASGSEPFITYILLGLVGGAFWSLPFTIYTIVRNQLSKH